MGLGLGLGLATLNSSAFSSSAASMNGNALASMCFFDKRRRPRNDPPPFPPPPPAPRNDSSPSSSRHLACSDVPSGPALKDSSWPSSPPDEERKDPRSDSLSDSLSDPLSFDSWLSWLSEWTLVLLLLRRRVLLFPSPLAALRSALALAAGDMALLALLALLALGPPRCSPAATSLTASSSSSCFCLSTMLRSSNDLDSTFFGFFVELASSSIAMRLFPPAAAAPAAAASPMPSANCWRTAFASTMRSLTITKPCSAPLMKIGARSAVPSEMASPG